MTLERWLPATLAHEMHHSRRITVGVGYGTTLGEAMVTEGLAEAFVDEAFPDAPVRPWGHSLKPDEHTRVWESLRANLWSPYGSTEHVRWFFGGVGVPRWTGYTVGYRLGAGYLEAHPDKKPSQLVKTTARDIVAGSGVGT